METFRDRNDPRARENWRGRGVIKRAPTRLTRGGGGRRENTGKNTGNRRGMATRGSTTSNDIPAPDFYFALIIASRVDREIRPWWITPFRNGVVIRYSSRIVSNAKRTGWSGGTKRKGRGKRKHSFRRFLVECVEITKIAREIRDRGIEIRGSNSSRELIGGGSLAGRGQDSKARGGSAEVKKRRIARPRESGSAESGRVGVEFEPWLGTRQGT